MQPLTRPIVPILLLFGLAAATPASSAGPIAGDLPLPPANSPARVAPPAETGSGSRALTVVRPDPTKTPNTATTVPLTPEERALLSIREDAHARVAELARRTSATADPASRYELQRQAQEIKRQAEIRFVETKISFARTRGDLAAAHELELALDRMLHPTARNVPAEPGSPVKGGAR